MALGATRESASQLIRQVREWAASRLSGGVVLKLEGPVQLLIKALFRLGHSAWRSRSTVFVSAPETV